MKEKPHQVQVWCSALLSAEGTGPTHPSGGKGEKIAPLQFKQSQHSISLICRTPSSELTRLHASLSFSSLLL